MFMSGPLKQNVRQIKDPKPQMNLEDYKIWKNSKDSSC